MLYQKQIHDYVQSHREEIIDNLKEIIKIPSVRGEAILNAPFGRDCAKVLEYIKNLYDENGFDSELDVNSGYLLAYFGDGEKSLGLFSHADVVPVADDWIFTEPFEPVEKEGYLIGRGTIDDKSAVAISLYCAKMIKELNIPFRSRLVCFTGANEESGMQDIKNYIKKHKAPEFSLVCDTAFPLYRGNKGMLLFNASCNIPFIKIKEMTGSNSKGAILGKVKIKLDYDAAVYSNLKKQENERISVIKENNEILIETHGISNHTALPEDSLNAGYLAFRTMESFPGLSESEDNQIRFITELLEKYYGEAIGIENTDEEFGRLSFANDMINFDRGKLQLHFNLRFGACVDIDSLKNKIEEEFNKMGWDVNFETQAPAHITDVNHPMIQACLDAFKRHRGYDNAVTYINAGGTYARYLPCAAETGTTLKWGTPKGMTQGHGGAHQPDECISIDGLLEALEVTMMMLLECDKKEAK